MPRSGKVKLQISQMQYASQDLQLDHDTGFGSIEFGGIPRNVDGADWFDHMTQRCTGQYYRAPLNPPASNGACLLTDILGDRIMVVYRGTAPRAGVQRLIGGTGRYAGISGNGSYTTTKLRPPSCDLCCSASYAAAPRTSCTRAAVTSPSQNSGTPSAR